MIALEGAVSAKPTPQSFTDAQVVVLRVQGGDYAVPIHRVQEIVRVPEITRGSARPGRRGRRDQSARPGAARGRPGLAAGARARPSMRARHEWSWSTVARRASGCWWMASLRYCA